MSHTEKSLRQALKQDRERFEEVSKSLDLALDRADQGEIKRLRDEVSRHRGNLIRRQRRLNEINEKRQAMRDATNELASQKNRKSKTDYQAKSMNPDDYYAWLIGRGFSPANAMEIVAKKYGQLNEKETLKKSWA